MSRILIPDYDLIRLLARGSAGSVYLARHQVTGDLVAIKHLRTDVDNVAARLRFEQEARIMQSLRHRSLVVVRDLLELEGEYFLVLEYIDGATLADALQLVEPTVGVAVIEQLASVLDVVHDAGVVHRDVKPANVLLSVSGECKLTDFGVARLVGDSIHVDARNGIRTKTGTVLGSPAYMSPEVAAGKRDIDRRADVYSLAVLAYRLIVGRLPFSGDPYTVLQSQINDAPPLPSGLEPTITEEVDDVLLRGLSKEPANRYQTASAFAAAFSTATKRTSDVVDEPGSTDPLVALVRSIATTKSGDAAREGDGETQSSTVDIVASDLAIRILPKLPKANVPIFRPRKRHRARILALVVAVSVGSAIGVIVTLLHR